MMKSTLKLHNIKDNLIELLFDDMCYKNGEKIPFETHDTFQLTGRIKFIKENKKYNLYFEGWIDKSYRKYWIPYKDYNQYLICNGDWHQTAHNMKDYFSEEKYFNL